MAHLSEQGTDDRRIPYNILLLALECLRPGSTQKKKNLKRTLPDGYKIKRARHVRVIGTGPAAASEIFPVSLPPLADESEQLGEVEDVTDDEAEDESADDEISGDDGEDEDDDDEEDADDDNGRVDVNSRPDPSNKRKRPGDDEGGRSGAGRGYTNLQEHKHRYGLRRTRAM